MPGSRVACSLAKLAFFALGVLACASEEQGDGGRAGALAGSGGSASGASGSGGGVAFAGAGAAAGGVTAGAGSGIAGAGPSAGAGGGGAFGGRAGEGGAGAGAGGTAGSSSGGAGAAGSSSGGAGGTAGSSSGGAGGTAGSSSGGAGAGGRELEGGAGGSAGVPTSCNTPEAELPVLRDWAAEVLGGTEFGGGDRMVRRFIDPVRVSLMGGNAAERQLLARVVDDLSLALEPSDMSVTLGETADDTAEILVWFAPYERFAEIAETHGFSLYSTDIGQFTVQWDGAQAYTRAWVLIASDLLQGEDLVHFTYEEVTQALGPSSDSALVPESIFYGTSSEGGDAQGLHCYDEALLHLLYAYLQPGDGSDAVRSAFDESWDVR